MSKRADINWANFLDSDCLKYIAVNTFGLLLLLNTTNIHVCTVHSSTILCNRQNWRKVPWQVLFPKITGKYFPTELKKGSLDRISGYGRSISCFGTSVPN